MCMDDCLHLCLCTELIISPGTDSCELPCECWEPKSSGGAEIPVTSGDTEVTTNTSVSRCLGYGNTAATLFKPFAAESF